MDTKLRGRTTVRIICFILILVFCFFSLNRILSIVIKAEETAIAPDIILANYSAERYFSQRNMQNPQYYASILANYGSAEAILAGNHLEWYTGFTPWHDLYNEDWYHYRGDWGEQYFELRSPGWEHHYVTIDAAAYHNEDIRKRHEDAAIRQQVSQFQWANEALSSIEGLLYYIYTFDFSVSSGQSGFEAARIVISNVEESNQTVDFFRSQPVFSLFHGYGHVEYSFDLSYWAGSPLYNNDVLIYLAFTSDVVSAQNVIFESARSAYIFDFVVIALCGIFALVALILLLVGSGRRTLLIDGKKERSEEVHFIPLDKLYLDIGLAILLFWSLFILFIAYITFSTIWYYKNIAAVNVLMACVVLFIVPPVLFWLTSLIKRIKAGHFWKHTLVYAVIFGLYNLAKKLWVGMALSLKVAAISVISFITMIFVTWLFVSSNNGFVLLFASFLVASVVTLLLLLYSRRIRSLERGAKAASEGNYDVPINAGGGELGNIANSINSISAGINKAVEERMKSERLKTELITNVSHDIRTPLTSIITYTDLLEREGLDSEKAADYLSILKQKSQRLKTLTEELFEAAKASTGNIDVNLADLNIVSLINQVLGELDNTISSSGLDLRVNLPDKLIAVADGRLMQRVMENLLSNVFKYSQEGSRVYLDVLSVSDKEVRIDIKNISASALNFDPSELMERFKRGDDSRTDGGNGLGLSIVQSFVSAQGGRFEIKIDGDLFKATVILPQPIEL